MVLALNGTSGNSSPMMPMTRWTLKYLLGGKEIVTTGKN